MERTRERERFSGSEVEDDCSGQKDRRTTQKEQKSGSASALCVRRGNGRYVGDEEERRTSARRCSEAFQQRLSL